MGRSKVDFVEPEKIKSSCEYRMFLEIRNRIVTSQYTVRMASQREIGGFALWLASSRTSKFGKTSDRKT
jgi:hypothetical protein